MLFLATLPLCADSWSLQHDNDLVFDSDDGYSAGLRIGWMGEPYDRNAEGSFNRQYVAAMSGIVSLLGVSFEERRRSGAIGIQALIVTPEDLERPEPIYDDVPYMGLLSSHFSLFSWNAEDVEEFRVSLGVLGPPSNAASVQKRVHRLIGATEPKGWDNQLGTHPVVQAGYTRGWRHYAREYGGSRRMEWFNSCSADIGTFYNGVGAGSVLRFGRNMPANFVTTSGLLSSSQSNRLALEERTKQPGWELRAGLGISAIGYLYLYDEAKRLGYTFDRPRFIPRGNIGASVYRERFHLSLDLFPAGSVGTNPESKSFGRIILVWIFG
jgi:lipid A 3-O-deacylase